MPVAMRKVFDQMFDFSQMSPLLEQRMLLEQMMLPMLLMQIRMHSERSYQQMSQAMAEESEREIRGDMLSRSETKTSDKKTRFESGETTEFSLMYYNPELRKVEVVEEKISMRSDTYSSPEQQTVEEAVAQKSMFGPYSMIASPIMLEKINPYILESVLSKIEVGSPGPFGGSAAVHIPNQAFAQLEHKMQKEGAEEEIVALSAIREIHGNKDLFIKAVGKEILVLEEAIKALQETEKKEDKILERLPALSRIRYLALLKKKASLERTLVADLFISDVEFLEAMRKRLKKMSMRDFVEIAKKFKMMFEKR